MEVYRPIGLCKKSFGKHHSISQDYISAIANQAITTAISICKVNCKTLKWFQRIWAHWNFVKLKEHLFAELGTCSGGWRFARGTNPWAKSLCSRARIWQNQTATFPWEWWREEDKWADDIHALFWLCFYPQDWSETTWILHGFSLGLVGQFHT